MFCFAKSEVNITINKASIKYLISHLYRCKWSNTDRVKVLVNTSRYYDETSWIRQFEAKNLVDKLDIVFCSNKWQVLRHIEQAKVCFLLGLSSAQTDLAKSSNFIYVPYFGVNTKGQSFDSNKVRILHPPSFASEAIAEYCISMSIAFRRRLHMSYHLQKHHRWDQAPYLLNTYQPANMTRVGVLGLGRVGSKVVQSFKRMGYSTLGCDSNKECYKFVDEYFTTDHLDVFLAALDVLVICLPLNKQTKDLIGKAQLSNLQKTCIIINVGRAQVINQKELIHALKAKAIGGAVLDVFENEPLSKFSPFYKMRNVLITPHVSGNMNLFVDRIQEDFVSQVEQRVLAESHAAY